MRNLRQSLDLLSKVLILFAVILTLIHGMTFWTRLTIRQHRANYRQGKFVVTDASVTRYEGNVDYDLTGTVAGREEHLFPQFPRGSEPRNKADLLRAYPLGTEISVIYNPDAPSTVFNGESSRLIQAGKSYFDEEPRRFRDAALKTFVPLPLAIIFFLIARYANKQHSNIKVTSEPA